MGGTQSTDDHWQKDSESPNCHRCGITFTLSNRRHHCRNCGYVFCAVCSRYTSTIPMRQIHMPVRVCGECFRTLYDSGACGGGSPVSSIKGGGSIYNSRESQNRQRSRSIMRGGSERFSGVPSAAYTQSAGHWDRESNCFVGAGGLPPSGNGTGADTTDNSNPSVRPWDVLGTTVFVGGDGSLERSADQLEKDRLLQCWPDVRQKAVFTDVLLQQVEKVDANTVVEYSRETEGIVLQLELPPDQLYTVFPFPLATEGNAQLLVEPVDLRRPACNNEITESAIRLVEQRLFLPPALSIPKCESPLLRQC